MKIEDVKVVVSCPGRNFVTVKIITDDGVYGLVDATVNGREMAVASYLSEHVAPNLMKRRPPTTPVNDPIFRSADWKTGRGGTGD